MASALIKLVFARLLIQFNVLPGVLKGSSGRESLNGSLSFEEFYVPNFGLEIRLRHRAAREGNKWEYLTIASASQVSP